MMIENEISYQENDKIFTLVPDERKCIAFIKVTIKIQDPELINSSFESNSEKREHTLKVHMDNVIVEDLLYEFQSMESMLAFPQASLRRIYWENPKYEFIPENQEEESKIMRESKVFKAEWTKSYDDGTFLSKDVFIDMMKNRKKYRDLLIPKAFFHEGMNQFKSFKYITAFFNFYFIIEDFYGDGKSQNAAVEKAFKESKEFRSFIQWAINNIVNDNDRRHFENISSYLKIYNKSFDVDGLIILIVRLRGQLHHYIGKSTQLQGTPLNHTKFESLAYLTYQIALRAILNKIMLINTQDKLME